MKKLLTLAIGMALSSVLVAQSGGVSINPSGSSPDPSAGLDISYPDKGLLIPRMSTSERNAILNPATGLQIFNTTTNCFNFWTGSSWKQACGDCDFNNPVAGNNGPICEGATLNLSATTIPGATYQWTGPNGFSSSQQNPTIPNATASANGSYSVAATLNGCTSQPQSTVATIHPTPGTPVASSNSPVCSGSSLELSVISIPGATYAWSGPDSYSTNVQNPSITNAGTNNAGTYSVIASINGCQSSTGSTSVSVIQSPQSTFTPSTALVSFPRTFTPTVSGAGYSWTFGSGSPSSSSIENPSVTWSTPGSYSVSLTVTSGGCSSTTNTTVAVNNPTTLTYSYTGSQQSFIVPDGVTSVMIECWGAQGGNSSTNGGLGGYAKGNLTVSPGNTLFIYVGGQGTNIGNSETGGAGYNGGGNSQGTSGGGGGASDVRFGAVALANRVIVAGGGGGGRYSGQGGAGGGLTGSNGLNGNVGSPGGGGGGATQSAGGTGGSPGNGSAGSLGQGGTGGNVSGIGYAGGGGGGYYGGGGGGGEITWGNGGGGGGGGGSSYIGGVTDGSTTSGVRTGHGEIKITY